MTASTGDEVVVWRASLDGPAADELAEILTPDELERAATFVARRDRDRFVLARATLRRVLGEHLGTKPDAVRIAYREQGKPYLPDAGTLRFNLSHSGDVLLIALCEEREVGVDVERLREVDAVKLARRWLAPEAAAAVAARSGSERTLEFFRAWVRMEAYAKARGGGLNLIGEWPDPARWSLSELDVGDGYAAALAVEGSAAPSIVSEVLGGPPGLAPE